MQKKFEELPEDLKWAIMAANIDEKITEIGKRHGLNVEELGQLSLETHAVTLGYTLPDKFEESIQESLKFPGFKTKEIVEEINEQILKGIRENLMSLHKREEEIAEKIKIPNGEEQEEIKEKPIAPKETKKSEEELAKDIQNKKIMESVSSQKLFGSFQSPTIKTEYTLNNISKGDAKEGTSSNQNVKIPLEAMIKPVSSETKEVSPSFSVKEDPYRMKPE